MSFPSNKSLLKFIVPATRLSHEESFKYSQKVVGCSHNNQTIGIPGVCLFRMVNLVTYSSERLLVMISPYYLPGSLLYCESYPAGIECGVFSSRILTWHSCGQSRTMAVAHVVQKSLGPFTWTWRYPTLVFCPFWILLFIVLLFWCLCIQTFFLWRISLPFW